MKANKHKAILIGVLVVGVGVLSIGNGCSKTFSNRALNSTEQSSSAPSVAATPTPSTDIEIIPGSKTVSIVYAKEILDHLSACSGLALPSDKTIAMYQQKQGAISTTGYVNTLTSPMMMAVTSISGEVCNDLINQEASMGPRLFVGYNFSNAVLPNSAQLSDSISRIALSCWQRNENTVERQALLDMVNSSIGVAEAMAGRKSAIMICTAMLSSLDSILN
ncbi:MAG: hypothetical protein WA160_14000 [Pseudobdellovibrio sp.]